MASADAAAAESDDRDRPSAASRPPVSVVMPFAGDRDAAARALASLAAIELARGDELILVDNSAEQLVRDLVGPESPIRVVAATQQASSYYARNVGADAAAGEWLLFIDSDCIASTSLVAEYMASPVADGVGAIAGAIVGDVDQHSVTARYSLDRGYLDQARHIAHPRAPYGVTANLLVRAAAFRSVGGFYEGIRSGGDTDFCWRLQDAGWALDYRPAASVIHRHRETLRAFIRATVRYAAGRAWLNRRYPSAFTPPGLLSAARAFASSVWWTVTGRRERGAFRAIDALVGVLDTAGGLLSNEPPAHRPSGASELVVFTDSFPELSETFIGAELEALCSQGHRVRVESRLRARRQDLRVARANRVDYVEDGSVLERARDLVWLIARRPLGCIRDLLARRRWRAEEPVAPLRTLAPAARRLQRDRGVRVHAHFAANAALNALRVAALCGRPYSVTAHAYEIFREPANLIEKLRRATVVTTGCEYNVSYLRGIVDAATARRIHEVIMGVDASRFARRRPQPTDRSVIAVGRLVEKKGFDHLIDAVALLQEATPIDRLTIVGAGPEADSLARRVDERGLQSIVRFAGALDHDAVRAQMEQAAVLAMPCVVAADGDRDSMPVVVKEALALEIPVVGSDEVGLPEVIEPAWGRLVPPGDARALATAIAELLALDAEQRAAMGRAGRRFVEFNCSVSGQTARLATLLELGRDESRAPQETAAKESASDTAATRESPR